MEGFPKNGGPKAPLTQHINSGDRFGGRTVRCCCPAGCRRWATSTKLAGSAADFAQLIAAETEKWGKVVKLSGAKAE